MRIRLFQGSNKPNESDVGDDQNGERKESSEQNAKDVLVDQDVGLVFGQLCVRPANSPKW